MTMAIQALRRLARVGFHAERLFIEDGRPAELMYARHHAGQREVVLVRNETSAVAYRTDHRVDEHQPFHIRPEFTFWHRYGDIVTVVHALLTVPRTDHGGPHDNE